MKKLYYHGTSLESFRNIIKNGFNNDDFSNWTCSGNNTTYFHDLEKYIECGEVEDREDKRLVIERAFESGQIAAACQKSKETSIVVLEFEFDDEEIDIEDDNSCQNMDCIASCIDNDDIDIDKHLKNVYICNYNPNLWMFVIASIIDYNYFNIDNFTDLEIQALELISKVDTTNIHEELSYFDFREVKVDYKII